MGSLLNTLRFVRGAVAAKDFVPVLTHFHIGDGRIQGSNGRLSIDAPIDLDLTATIPADRFIKAIDSCDEDPELKITDAGRLSISRGPFRALLPMAEHESYPKTEPVGDEIATVDDEFMSALRVAAPFMANDASRPWACGVWLSDGYVYATNNVSIIRVEIPWDGPDLNLPLYLVNELLRLGSPDRMFVDGNQHLTCFYGDAWLRSNLLDLKWPIVTDVLSGAEGDLPEPPPGLLAAIHKIIPFCPDKKAPVIRFTGDAVATDDGDMSAAVSGFDLPEARFRAEILIRVLELADLTGFELSGYPRVYFNGPEYQGAIMGMIK